MRKPVIDRFKREILRAKLAFPSYSIVVSGHSMGGVLATLSALSLVPPVTYNGKVISLRPDALFTFGAPISGTRSFANWAAKCIGVSRIVRVVMEDDIIPWFRSNRVLQQASVVNEIFNEDAMRPVWKQCLGNQDPSCSSKFKCFQRTWLKHSFLAGLHGGRRLCLLGK